MEIEHLFRYTALAVGLKPFLSAWKPLRGWRVRHLPRAESALCGVDLVRYTARAVGLKPSAIQGEARLRGTRTPTVTLSAIAYRLSATISPRLSRAKPACAGYGGSFLQRPYALGYPGRSPPARNATLLVRAEALPERMEAPAGLACPSPSTRRKRTVRG
jgi:hypothetical protein